jgi:hypothetical protein
VFASTDGSRKARAPERAVWFALAFFVLFLSGSARLLLSGAKPHAWEDLFVVVGFAALLYIGSKQPSKHGWPAVLGASLAGAIFALVVHALVSFFVSGLARA